MWNTKNTIFQLLKLTGMFGKLLFSQKFATIYWNLDLILFKSKYL